MSVTMLRQITFEQHCISEAILPKIAANENENWCIEITFCTASGALIYLCIHQWRLTMYMIIICLAQIIKVKGMVFLSMPTCCTILIDIPLDIVNSSEI